MWAELIQAHQFPANWMCMERCRTERTVHDLVALGAVFAADVFNDADVASLDDDVGGVVVAVERGAEVGDGGIAYPRNAFSTFAVVTTCPTCLCV